MSHQREMRRTHVPHPAIAGGGSEGWGDSSAVDNGSGSGSVNGSNARDAVGVNRNDDDDSSSLGTIDDTGLNEPPIEPSMVEVVFEGGAQQQQPRQQRLEHNALGSQSLQPELRLSSSQPPPNAMVVKPVPSFRQQPGYRPRLSMDPTSHHQRHSQQQTGSEHASMGMVESLNVSSLTDLVLTPRELIESKSAPGDETSSATVSGGPIVQPQMLQAGLTTETAQHQQQQQQLQHAKGGDSGWSSSPQHITSTFTSQSDRDTVGMSMMNKSGNIYCQPIDTWQLPGPFVPDRLFSCPGGVVPINNREQTQGTDNSMSAIEQIGSLSLPGGGDFGRRGRSQGSHSPGRRVRARTGDRNGTVSQRRRRNIAGDDDSGGDSDKDNDRKANANGTSPRNRNVRVYPCQARGIPDEEHTPENAVIVVPRDAVHGAMFYCGSPTCRAMGRVFRWCAVCRLPVAKGNFMQRHDHNGIYPMP